MKKISLVLPLVLIMGFVATVGIYSSANFSGMLEKPSWFASDSAGWLAIILLPTYVFIMRFVLRRKNIHFI